MPSVSGYVGPLTLSDGGTTGGLRQDKTGALVTNPAGRYAELAARGLLYSAAIPPGTGQAPGTAIGTTACMTLANGATNTVNLVLLEIEVGYISGTLGAGTLALLAHFSAGAAITAPASGTAITPTNIGKMSSGAASVANCRFNNTVPASGLMIRAICGLGASLASTAAQPWSIKDDIGGGVVLEPGTAVSVQGIAAAGSTPLITVSMLWAEVAR